MTVIERSDRGSRVKMFLLGGLICLSPALLTAGPVACPSTVALTNVFPTSTSYVCSETDNVWYQFQDLGAVTTGETALPTGTIFHIDTISPNDIAITVEPGATAQFVAGDIYSWTFSVAEDAITNIPVVGVDADYGAEGTSPTLTTTVTALTNFTGYNADGTPIDTVGSQIGSLTVSNGSTQQIGVSPVLGVTFKDTLTGIGGNTEIQSLSNSIEEAPEPRSIYLLGLAIIVLGLKFRRRIARAF
jgi:hypothetical protein